MLTALRRGSGRVSWLRVLALGLLVLSLAFSAVAVAQEDCADLCDTPVCDCACHLSDVNSRPAEAVQELHAVSSVAPVLHLVPPDFLLPADIYRPPIA